MTTRAVDELRKVIRDIRAEGPLTDEEYDSLKRRMKEPDMEAAFAEELQKHGYDARKDLEHLIELLK